MNIKMDARKLNWYLDQQDHINVNGWALAQLLLQEILHYVNFRWQNYCHKSNWKVIQTSACACPFFCQVRHVTFSKVTHTQLGNGDYRKSIKKLFHMVKYPAREGWTNNIVTKCVLSTVNPQELFSVNPHLQKYNYVDIADIQADLCVRCHFLGTHICYQAFLPTQNDFRAKK